MNPEALIAKLGQWGQVLSLQDTDYEIAAAIAERENPWFTRQNIDLAIENICTRFLDPSRLMAWLSHYPGLPAKQEKRIALVMAGNIPLVGFHDLLSVIAAGHHAVVKPSDKDPHLLPFVVEKLRQVAPDLADSVSIVPKLKDFDAVIATGSNNSARYFLAYFGAYPHVIRKNRNGVAVLTGKETPAELDGLADDVFQYFGLGCRNVSQVLVPQDYDFDPLLQAFQRYRDVRDHNKFRNNLDYNTALWIISGRPHIATDFLLLAEDKQVVSRIGSLHFWQYSDNTELKSHLDAHLDAIQCVISTEPVGNLPHVPFGQSQSPSLEEYADGVDIMDFLMQLEV